VRNWQGTVTPLEHRTRAASHRLLVIDDNRELADNLIDIFGSRGFSVRIAPSAREGLDAARADGFALAFVDVKLPDSSGLDLLPALRDACPLGEVVLMTGHATIDSAIAAVRGGAFHYVIKPFKVDDLIATAESALRNAELRVEREALQRRAAEAEALAHMGTLAAGLAHEIRNPLNAAGLQLHLLGRKVERLADADRTALRSRIDIVAAELKRLERLLTDFLELARPKPMAREPVDLRALLDDVAAFHEPTAQSRGIRFERKVSDVDALGDRERLKQVFHNLVVNALEASHADGAVTVSCGTDPDDPSFVYGAVRDAGRGIPGAALAQIFEPFFTTKEAGTGLGLSIVRQIAERHGGSVRVWTEEGRGTEVTVRIPARGGT